MHCFIAPSNCTRENEYCGVINLLCISTYGQQTNRLYVGLKYLSVLGVHTILIILVSLFYSLLFTVSKFKKNIYFLFLISLASSNRLPDATLSI